MSPEDIHSSYSGTIEPWELVSRALRGGYGQTQGWVTSTHTLLAGDGNTKVMVFNHVTCLTITIVHILLGVSSNLIYPHLALMMFDNQSTRITTAIKVTAKEKMTIQEMQH